MNEADVLFLDRLNDAADAVTLPLFRTALTVDAKISEAKTLQPGDFDPVTEADRQGELALRRLIGAEFPNDGIAGEEFPDHHIEASRVWHLDPIDGTRQFVSGVPLWGTMIGLSVDGLPVLGSISHPFTQERFYGDGETTLYRRGAHVASLRTRPCLHLNEAILFSTGPNMYQGIKAERFAALSHQVRLTRFGIDCYAFCLVALGFVDIVVEAGLDDHDIIPAVPIIEAAGGAVVDWHGARARGGGDVVAVGDRRLVEPVLRLLDG